MPKISTTQYRTDATSFPDELSARAAVMQYCGEIEDLPASAFNMREYRGEGFFVLTDIGNGCFRWLKEI